MRPGTRYEVLLKADLDEAGIGLSAALEALRVAPGAVLVTETDETYTVWWHEDALPVDPLQQW